MLLSERLKVVERQLREVGEMYGGPVSVWLTALADTVQGCTADAVLLQADALAAGAVAADVPPPAGELVEVDFRERKRR